MTLPDTLIIAFAVLDLVFLILLMVVGLRFKTLAGRASKSAHPLIQRGQNLVVTGNRLTANVGAHMDTMLAVTKALAHNLSAKLETTRRMVAEVVHPEASSLATVARTVEQGQAWTARLSRLGAAARRAADHNGGSRQRT